MTKEQVLELLGSLKENLENELKEYGFPIENLSVKFMKDKVVVTIKGEIDTKRLSEKMENPLLTRAYGLTASTFGRGSETDVGFTATKIDREGLDEETSEELTRQVWDASDRNFQRIVENYKSEFNRRKLDIILAAFEGDAFDLIPSKIKDQYEGTGNLGFIKSWKAKVQINNNGQKVKIGDWSTVGYTMVNLDTGAIIPIAREDEHHTGYDLIRHLISKKLIPQGRYYPIFYSHDYVYDDRREDALQAFKIWRRLGGPNVPLEKIGRNSVDAQDVAIWMDDYIKAEGKIDIPKGEISEFGKKIISGLEYIHQEAEKVAYAQNAGNKAEIDVRQLFKVAASLFNHLDGYHFFMDIKELQKRFNEVYRKKDVNELIQIMLGHSGYKNIIHMDLKKSLEKEDSWYLRDLNKVFGDVHAANKEFNRLGSQY